MLVHRYTYCDHRMELFEMLIISNTFNIFLFDYVLC